MSRRCTYRLTRLLRGQAGSEQAMAAGAATGADFVLLDGAVAPLPMRADQLGLPLRYRIGPAQDDHAAPSFAETSLTAEGTRALAVRAGASESACATPARATSRFRGSGARASAARRWELAEVPLNEEREAYRIEILDGPDVLRTVETATPAYLYALAEQTADFGGPATPLSLRVTQLSAAVGTGLKLQETVDA